MKKLILIIFLISTSILFAQSKLPKCQGSDITKYNNCFGEFEFPSHGKYVGEFKDGMFYGRGTLTFVNGEKYVGEFKNGKPNGKGTHTNINGNGTIYVGEFKDGLKHGQGTLTFKDGGKYVGGFKDENFHGQATLFGKNGYVRKLTFIDGTLVDE